MIDDPTTDGAQWDGATKPSSSAGSKPAPSSDTHVPKPKDAGRRPPQQRRDDHADDDDEASGVDDAN